MSVAASFGQFFSRPLICILCTKRCDFARNSWTKKIKKKETDKRGPAFWITCGEIMQNFFWFTKRIRTRGLCTRIKKKKLTSAWLVLFLRTLPKVCTGQKQLFFAKFLEFFLIWFFLSRNFISRKSLNSLQFLIYFLSLKNWTGSRRSSSKSESSSASRKETSESRWADCMEATFLKLQFLALKLSISGTIFQLLSNF